MTEPSTRRRRPHPAIGARIVTAGLGATSMFGLVAAMGFAAAPDGDPAPVPVVAAAPAAGTTRATTVHHTTAPQVTVAAPTAAPAAQSHGSR